MVRQSEQFHQDLPLFSRCYATERPRARRARGNKIIRARRCFHGAVRARSLRLGGCSSRC
jgi:hypothetical protein